jgi:hypothetical protein
MATKRFRLGWLLTKALVFLATVCFSSDIGQAGTIFRAFGSATTPMASDFPVAMNSHPTQVGYSLVWNSSENKVFRDTFRFECGQDQRLIAAHFEIRMQKISVGDGGDNDSLTIYVNGKKYGLTIWGVNNASWNNSPAGLEDTFGFDLNNVWGVNAGPGTATVTQNDFAPTNSMLADLQIGSRVSFLVQDDSNVVYAKLDFTCETIFVPNPTIPNEVLETSSCCPPWNAAILQKYLFYKGQGSAAAPYALKFDPSVAFLSAAQNYVNYIHGINAALTNLNIEFQVYEQGFIPLPFGTNGIAVGPVSGMGFIASGSAPALHTNYNSNTPRIFPGTSLPGTYITPSSYPFQPNRWYLVHTGMWTDSIGFFDKALCSNNDILVRAKTVGGSVTLQFKKP